MSGSVFGEAMRQQREAWQAITQGPAARETAAARQVTLDPGLDGPDRTALAAYLDETAARTASAGGPVADLIASCVRAIGSKISAEPGAVTVKVTRLDAGQQMLVRRVLWSSADRARSGLADAGLAVRDGMERLTEQWGHAIGYDPKPGWSGPRNRWQEPGPGLPPSAEHGWIQA